MEQNKPIMQINILRQSLILPLIFAWKTLQREHQPQNLSLNLKHCV